MAFGQTGRLFRTTIEDVKESGYRYRVTADLESVEGLADELLDELRGAAEINMHTAQEYVVSEVKNTLGYPGHGEPSRPNEPPRYQEGDLRDSWRRGRRYWRRNKTELRGAVESWHPAAGPLEFGALRALGIAPRPYYRPTLARIADRVAHIMAGDL